MCCGGGVEQLRGWGLGVENWMGGELDGWDCGGRIR